MASAQEIYEFGTSSEDAKPSLNSDTIVNNDEIDWLAIGDVIDGDKPVEMYRAPSLTVARADMLHWHYYMCGGPTIMSAELKTVLEPFARPCFDFLPLTLNGHPFFFLCRRQPLDCLDVGRSKVRRFRSKPDRIMLIDEYAFRSDVIEDPKLFCIPDLRGREYATESIKRMVEEAGLKGVRFDLLCTFS